MKKKKLITYILSALIVIAAIVAAVILVKHTMSAEPTTTTTIKETTTEEPTTVLLSYALDKKYHTSEFHVKQVMGHVLSDDLNLNCNLVYGSSDECLSFGAGLHKCSSLPGMKTPLTPSATCPIIAGHCRTVFEGFSKIDPKNGELPKGLTITLSMPYGDYTYEVVKAEVAKASDFKFSDHRASFGNYEPDTAIFYTCYPFGVVNYVKTDRLFITCKLIEGNEVVDDSLAPKFSENNELVANDIG